MQQRIVSTRSVGYYQKKKELNLPDEYTRTCYGHGRIY